MLSRARVAALSCCLLLATAGCLGFLTGDEPMHFAAEPATVDGAALDETGYEQYREATTNRTRNYSAAGQTRQVTVTNEIRGYNRTLGLGPLGERDLGRFVVLSTPAVSIAGQTFNPVGDWSNRRLVREFTSAYDGVENVQFEENRTVQALGEPRTVSRYTGETEIAGQPVDVAIHVTKFRHGDDFVVAFAVHPEMIDGEADRIDELLRGLDHEG